MEKKIQVTIKIPSKIHKALKDIAAHSGMRQVAIYEAAFEEFVKNPVIKAPDLSKFVSKSNGENTVSKAMPF